MLIEPLLGYKSTWRILKLLFETPRKPVSRGEMFKFTKLGNSPLSRGLERLVRTGILVLEKRKKKEFYYVNERNEYAQELKALWDKEKQSLRNLPYDISVVLSEFVRSLNDSCCSINQVILFGSHAKGTASAHSDIDIAVVFNNNLLEEIFVVRIVKKLEQQFKVKIQVHYFTAESFALKSKLITEIKREGINLIT